MSADDRSDALQRDTRGSLAEAIRSSPFGVFIVDSDFRLIHLSAQRVFSNVNPLLGLGFADAARLLWPEPFADEVVGMFRHCLESGKAFHGPASELSGLAGSVDWQVERIRLPDGRPGVACQFYDLRDREHMEAVMRRSEQRFRLALDAARALVYEVDVGGNFAVAYGLERVTGYRPQEVNLTLDWWYTLIHPDDLPAHRVGVARHLLEGGSEARVFRIRHKDGRWIWVESIGQVLKDELEPSRLIGALVDITPRKLAEQRLRTLHGLSGRLLAANELMPALEDVIDCAVASCGARAGAVQLFNTELQGLEVVAHRGLSPSVLDHFRIVRVDDDSVAARALQGGEQFMIEDVELDPQFERHRAVVGGAGFRALLATPLKAHQAKVVIGMLTLYFADPRRVPERERQLIELYARDAANFISRLRFEQALRNAERSKDEFLAMLAHELRVPLAPLTHALELMKRAVGDARVFERMQATMERQLVLLNRLVSDLLDMSRITSHKLELRMEDLDLASVAFHAAEACRPLIERRSQTLSIELPPMPIHLRADPARLTQVFCNLILNASKYTDAGGRIRITAERDGTDVKVYVIDTGCGIPPELLPRIFDLFMQVDQPPARSGGGLGIGLSLVRRLVEMHHGTVTAQSEGLGRGSRFIVRLPAADSPTPGGVSRP